MVPETTLFNYTHAASHQVYDTEHTFQSAMKDSLLMVENVKDKDNRWLLLKSPTQMTNANTNLDKYWAEVAMKEDYPKSTASISLHM